MVTKKIKKSGASLTDIAMLSLLSAVIFFSLFYWVTMNTDTSTGQIPDQYNKSYAAFEESQNDLGNTAEEIQAGIGNVTESPAGFFTLSGLKGLLAILRLPLDFIKSTNKMYEASRDTLSGYVPKWIDAAIILAILVLVVFAVLRIYRGDPSSI